MLLRSQRTKTTGATTMTLALLSLLLAGSSTRGSAAVVSAFGRRLARRSYGFLAPAAGLMASSSPSMVVKAAGAAASTSNSGNAAAATATTTTAVAADLVNRRGGAGGVFGSLTRLFSSGGGGDAIRTDAPAVKALEASGAGAGEGFKGDLLVLPVFQPEEGEGLVVAAAQPILAAWDKELGGALAELVQTVRSAFVWVCMLCERAAVGVTDRWCY